MAKSSWVHTTAAMVGAAILVALMTIMAVMEMQHRKSGAGAGAGAGVEGFSVLRKGYRAPCTVYTVPAGLKQPCDRGYFMYTPGQLRLMRRKFARELERDPKNKTFVQILQDIDATLGSYDKYPVCKFDFGRDYFTYAENLTPLPLIQDKNKGAPEDWAFCYTGKNTNLTGLRNAKKGFNVSDRTFKLQNSAGNTESTEHQRFAFKSFEGKDLNPGLCSQFSQNYGNHKSLQYPLIVRDPWAGRWRFINSNQTPYTGIPQSFANFIRNGFTEEIRETPTTYEIIYKPRPFKLRVLNRRRTPCGTDLQPLIGDVMVDARLSRAAAWSRKPGESDSDFGLRVWGGISGEWWKNSGGHRKAVELVKGRNIIGLRPDLCKIAYGLWYLRTQAKMAGCEFALYNGVRVGVVNKSSANTYGIGKTSKETRMSEWNKYIRALDQQIAEINRMKVATNRYIDQLQKEIQGYKDTQGVEVFEHPNYTGRVGTFPVGSFTKRDLANRKFRNDSMSAIRIKPGYAVILYEHDNFRGQRLVLTESVPDLRKLPMGRSTWDNKVTSLQIGVFIAGKFDSDAYLRRHPDVARKYNRNNAIYHYAKFGIRESRLASVRGSDQTGRWVEERYLPANRIQAGRERGQWPNSPFSHFQNFGWRENRNIVIFSFQDANMRRHQRNIQTLNFCRFIIAIFDWMLANLSTAKRNAQSIVSTIKSTLDEWNKTYINEILPEKGWRLATSIKSWTDVDSFDGRSYFQIILP